MNRYKKKIIAIALTVMMFAGCIVPFELGTYANTDKFTITWMNHDGTVLEKDEYNVGETATPSFDRADPTRGTDGTYVYTFEGWSDKANSESGNDVGELPDATTDVIYYAAFSKAQGITGNLNIVATGGFQSVTLKWSGVSGYNGAKVYYQVYDPGHYDKNGKWIANRWVDCVEKTTFKTDFDPYPGNAKGEAIYGNNKKSAEARKASYTVRAYIKDPVTGNPVKADKTISNIEVVHPMYVIVKVKGKAKILKNSKSSKSVGKTKKNGYYIAFGGSRIKGENKRVIIKVNGTARYIKAGSVSKYKYVYRSTVGKNYYKGKAGYCFTNQQIEDFVNDKKPASNNNFFLYVDTYHQRLYMLTRAYKGAAWHIATDYKYHDLLASTGRQLSPYGSYKVANTMARKKTTGTKWWLLFNHIGIHEKLGEKLGKPASGGCIRVPDPASKWFFDHIKKGTGVFIY